MPSMVDGQFPIDRAREAFEQELTRPLDWRERLIYERAYADGYRAREQEREGRCLRQESFR